MVQKTNVERILHALQVEIERNDGKTVPEIAEKAECSSPTVIKYLEIMKAEGTVDCYQRSGVNFWFLKEKTKENDNNGK